MEKFRLILSRWLDPNSTMDRRLKSKLYFQEPLSWLELRRARRKFFGKPVLDHYNKIDT
jgi:hypothetical protein